MIRRSLLEFVSLTRRAVVALEQMAGSLEVIQTVVVEAIEEEQRRLAEADGRPEPLSID
jgi:hypothetical protein